MSYLRIRKLHTHKLCIKTALVQSLGLALENDGLTNKRKTEPDMLLDECRLDTYVYWRAQKKKLKNENFADMRKPKLAAEIAKTLHEFHQVEIPGPNEPQLWNDIFKFFRKGTFSKLYHLRWLRTI